MVTYSSQIKLLYNAYLPAFVFTQKPTRHSREACPCEGRERESSSSVYPHEALPHPL